MRKSAFLILSLTFITTQSFNHGYTNRKKHVIVWQPSHQTDTGKDFSEAATCGAIVDAAIETKPHLKEYKVWSLGRTDVHHADSGSNTVVAHTTAIVDGKISGYAYELQEANKKHPEIFIAVHNNGGTKRNAIWGYIHYGDKYENEINYYREQLVKNEKNLSIERLKEFIRQVES